jgi:hypothetical protein
MSDQKSTKFDIESFKKASGESSFERFPKIILVKICEYLEDKEIMKLSRCSKTLTFSLLCSNYSQQIWKQKTRMD